MTNITISVEQRIWHLYVACVLIFSKKLQLTIFPMLKTIQFLGSGYTILLALAIWHNLDFSIQI